MKVFRYIKSALLIAITATILTSGAMYTEKVDAQPVPSVQQTVQSQNYTSPIAIVNSPKSYLGKNVTMSAKFDKFSTLGLDYKPAFKSSDDYISFLIKRNDTTHNIPLSEMKLFLKRDLAEKFIDLKTDDKIEIRGIVFSDALGDAWIDVSEIKIIQKTPETSGKEKNKA